jgi:hypothetical protein
MDTPNSPSIFAVVAKITLGKFETSFSRLAKQRTYRCFDAASLRRTQPLEKINGLLTVRCGSFRVALAPRVCSGKRSSPMVESSEDSTLA